MTAKITPPNAVSNYVARVPHAGSPARAEVTRRAERMLRQCGYRPLSEVRCSFQDGVLSLHGSVPTYYMKQVAQTVVGKLEEVRRIDNQLDVELLPR